MIGRLTASVSVRSRHHEAKAPVREDTDRKLFHAIGEFLSEHRLAPSPANYAIVHVFVTESDTDVVRAVNSATYGDIRLSQADVDAIAAQAQTVRPEASVAGASASVAELVRAIDEARTGFDRYAGIVDSSRQDAQAYGDALVSEAATLSPARSASGAETVAALLALTESMVDKTRRAEEQLRAASAEMDDLRANLAAARQDAETDPLTGLLNRRAFEACFAEILAAPDVRAVSLALCDIDRFKAVNDRYGHDVGDRVIRLVAGELTKGCEGGVVARYGGEEFVILFEGRQLEPAHRLLDRTREALSSRRFRVAGTGETLDGLSFSGGIIAIAPGEECRDAMRRADAALYRAKQNGRNRIEQGNSAPAKPRD